MINHLSFFTLLVLFQNSEGKGMLDLFTSLFQRKKSGKRRKSTISTSSSSPKSPVSPRFPSSQQEDEPKTPTNSRKDDELAGSHYMKSKAESSDTLSQTSSPSASSMVSLKTDDLDLPFADSHSSGRSSVREVHVCRVSTAGDEGNSGKATSTAVELESDTHPIVNPYSDLDFARSVVEEVSKRLQVNLDENMPNSSEENIVSPTIPMSVNVAETPKSPNLTSISLASKKTEVRVGEKGHSTALKGITLGSRSATLHSITTQEEMHPPEIERQDSGVGISTDSLSEKTTATIWSPSPETQKIPRADSPVQVHRAIWVETYLGEEQEGEGERLKQEEEGVRADSPPVLAIPVTVIPEDDSVPQEENPFAPSESLTSGSLPESVLAVTSEAFQTISPQPEEPITGIVSTPGSLQEKSTRRETRVTRTTVNLPSKNKVFAQRVFINPELGLEGGEEDIRESTSETSNPAELKL